MKTAKKLLVLILTISALAFLAWAGFSLAYQNKFYPNTAVGQSKIGGLTKEEAKKKIMGDYEDLLKKPVWLNYKTTSYRFRVDEGDLKFKVEESLKKALEEKTLTNIAGGQNVVINLEVSRDFQKRIAGFFRKEINQEKVEESLKISQNGNVNYNGAQPQIRFNKEGTEKNIKERIGKLDSFIPIAYREDWPEKRDLGLLKVYYQLTDLLYMTPIELTYKNEIFGQIGAGDLTDWVEVVEPLLVDCNLKKGCLTANNWERNEAKLEINEEKIDKYLASLKKSTNQPAKNAKLGFAGGRVIIKEPSQIGQKIKTRGLKKKLKNLINSPKPEIEIAINRTEPEVHEGNINQLGIRELIGKGETTFYGSSSNRIHNIRNGAQTISGSLVAPGEIYSAAEVIGNDVSAATGYLPELVIKDGETKKEYGGGLCQISSTLFRSALRSGMEVVERHPHGYRVSYYEPPIGMDAAIYTPYTDLKFKNNTNHWILIEYEMSGYHLAFNFYGTDDGRKVTISQPRAYNFTPPPEPIEVVDKSLKPGERVLEEKSHQGADAAFDYKVVKNGKTIIDRTITSHYQAWPARYRIGPKVKGKKDNKKKDKQKKDEPKEEDKKDDEENNKEEEDEN